MTPPDPSGAGSQSQTLSRGIRALELLAEAENPLSIAELSEGLGVHRSIAYRILRTLEAHSLVMRDDAGRVAAAPGLAALARGVSRDLQSAALPELSALANELSMTAFIAVWDSFISFTSLWLSGPKLSSHLSSISLFSSLSLKSLMNFVNRPDRSVFSRLKHTPTGVVPMAIGIFVSPGCWAMAPRATISST